MSFTTITAGTLEYLRADGIPARHAFTTRYGGVSSGCLASLNLGIHRGDRPGNVIENWRRLGDAVGFDWKKTVFTHQIHTDLIRSVSAKDAGQGLIFPAENCDGVITNASGLTLAAFSADCTLILLQDPVAGAVGAIHAGWRGTALGIAQKGVEAMSAAFGCEPQNIRAAIGPCIDRCCFETSSDVPDAMVAALGEDAKAAIDSNGDGKYHVDLKDLNITWLQRAGVTRIQTCPFCTACSPNRFWSHRRAGDRRGSLAAVITCP